MTHRVLIVSLCVAVMTPAAPVFARQDGAQPSGARGTTTPAAPGTAAIDPDALPVNVDRIQRILSHPPAIKPDSLKAVFRIEIFGRKPTITEILGPDFLKGPTPAGAMTHQEFLDLVTPDDVRGYAAFDNKQGMIVAATSFALQWAVRQAWQKFEDAKTERQKEAARKEVETALAALRQARREAGLPDK